ncbi:MAG: GIY-YIG nuclease family protein [Melioribacteraceae bacterium]
MENKDNVGYIYILASPNSDCIKIGGTEYPPLKRIKEINSSDTYKNLGPWSLIDFRQVKNWRKVEYNLHYSFRSRLNKSIKHQKELFRVSTQEVSKSLNMIEPEEIIKKPKIDRMFQDEEFFDFIINLFKFTGLMNWLNIQGAWTFVLFPSTVGGRYFTINIGPHEVAFSTVGKKNRPQWNMILLDRLILDFEEVLHWISFHKGMYKTDCYATALQRSVSIFFPGSFGTVNEFLKLDGVRRALIAYWNEALIRMNEKGLMSTFIRYHNWNAVAEILNRMVKNNINGMEFNRFTK